MIWKMAGVALWSCTKLNMFCVGTFLKNKDFEVSYIWVNTVCLL